MSFGVFSNKRDLLLVVGSSSVSGAIVDFSNPRPRIVHTHEFAFPVKTEVNSADLSNQMLSALHSVISGLHKEHKNKIDTAHVILSSPWFSSYSKPFEYQSPNVFKVTQDKLEELVSGQVNFENKKELLGSENIERAVTQIKINGYVNSSPIGKTTKSISASVYVSSTQQVLKDKVESEITTVLHPHSISFYTLPFTTWNVMSGLFSKNNDFALVDIGGEITDLLISRQGHINSMVSFPFGKNHLSRRIALNFNVQPEIANSLLNLFSDNSLEIGISEKLKKLVLSFGNEWVENVLHGLRTDDEQTSDSLPHKIYLTTDSRSPKVFSEIIKERFSEPFVITRETLSNFVDYDGKDLPDPNIAIGVVYTSGLVQQVGLGKKT